jgi:hypothetical protein
MQWKQREGCSNGATKRYRMDFKGIFQSGLERVETKIHRDHSGKFAGRFDDAAEDAMPIKYAAVPTMSMDDVTRPSKIQVEPAITINDGEVAEAVECNIAEFESDSNKPSYRTDVRMSRMRNVHFEHHEDVVPMLTVPSPTSTVSCSPASLVDNSPVLDEETEDVYIESIPPSNELSMENAEACNPHSAPRLLSYWTAIGRETAVTSASAAAHLLLSLCQEIVLLFRMMLPTPLFNALQQARYIMKRYTSKSEYNCGTAPSTAVPPSTLISNIGSDLGVTNKDDCRDDVNGTLTLSPASINVAESDNDPIIQLSRTRTPGGPSLSLSDSQASEDGSCADGCIDATCVTSMCKFLEPPQDKQTPIPDNAGWATIPSRGDILADASINLVKTESTEGAGDSIRHHSPPIGAKTPSMTSDFNPRISTEQASWSMSSHENSSTVDKQGSASVGDGEGGSGNGLLFTSSPSDVKANPRRRRGFLKPQTLSAMPMAGGLREVKVSRLAFIKTLGGWRRHSDDYHFTSARSGRKTMSLLADILTSELGCDISICKAGGMKLQVRKEAMKAYVFVDTIDNFTCLVSFVKSREDRVTLPHELSDFVETTRNLFATRTSLGRVAAASN